MARRDITGAVDFPYLEAYAAGDAGLIEEVLGLFDEQATLWLRLLDPEGDPGTWRDGAHTLKGASGGVGARTLAAVCSDAEKAAGESAAFKSAILDRLKSELDLVRADIAAYRHEQALRSLKS
jgi:HPt (histidine-containing phosphotransfer) domain-containing protein